MKKLITKVVMVIALSVLFSSCLEHYSDGERIGYITKFSRKGVMFKSWEGHLNMTQTGMNSADGWDFSIDNDMEGGSANDIQMLKNAADS